MIEIDIENKITQVLRELFNDAELEFDKSRFAGGLTNYNYLMDIQGQTYVIRKPGALTDQIINRTIEKENNAVACGLGMNSECLYFDDKTGIKISYFIKDSQNFAMANPYDLSQISAVVSHLKTLHNAPALFQNHFDFEEELARYETIVESLKGDLFFDYQSIKQKLLTYQQEKIDPMAYVSCHNDTVPENFLRDGQQKTYLIDWEYAGLNDATWDLAAYILESRLPEEEVSAFLNLYYNPVGPTDSILHKIKFFVLAQDLLWTVWALIRHYGGDDFLDYCYMRYERLRENINHLDKLHEMPISKLY